MKRILALLMVAVLLCTLGVQLAYAEETKPNNPIKCSVPIWGNLYTKNFINILYQDNRAYISIDDACELTGCKITNRDNDNQVELERGFLEMLLSNDKKHIKINGSQFDMNMGWLKYEKNIYVPIEVFFTYVGAEFKIDSNDSIPIKVYMPETLDSILLEYVENNYGYHFYWSETSSSEKEVKKKIENAAIVSLLFEYDFGVFKSLITNYNQEMDEDALTQILLNEGNQNLDDIKYSKYDFIKSDIETTDTIHEWVDFFNEIEKNDDIKFWSGVVNKFENFEDAATNFADAVNSVKQYSAITKTQPDLLKNTLLKVSDKSEVYKIDKNMYKAANNVQNNIDKSYNTTYATATETFKNELETLLTSAGNTAGNTVTPFQCFSVAWSGAKLITKLLANNMNIIERKTLLHQADICRSIQEHAYLFFYEKFEQAYNESFISQEYNESLKQSLILKLKATLTARENLLASKFVDADYAVSLKEDITALSTFLNRTEKCSVRISSDKVRNDDWSWLKNHELKSKEEIQKIYEDFIKNKGYENDVKKWENQIDKYAIIDVDQNGIAELFVNSKEAVGAFSNDWVYTYDNMQKKVICLSSIYHYGNLRYSLKYKTLAFTELKPDAFGGSIGFYKLNGSNLFALFNNKEEKKYAYSINKTKKSISATEFNQYLNELTDIEYLNIPYSSVGTKNKTDIVQYLGKDVNEVSKKISGMKDVGTSNGSKEFSNGSVTISASYDSTAISFISIDSPCDYSILGIYFGMNYNDAYLKLIKDGWISSSEAGETKRYIKGKDEFAMWLESNKLVGISYFKN